MKIRRLNEDASRFYIDEIVSAQGGKTETERHSFSTIEELKQYCKDAGLTKDDIANCGGCDVKDLCEGLDSSLHIQCCPACGCQNDYSDSQDNGSWVRYTCRSCGNTWDIDEPKTKDTVNEEVEKLHTKPNGEYLVKADSGKGYTAFSRDNVAIGGIDNEDADSDDKAIDKFKRNEYSECLNEAYFDTPGYRIQRYEDDIPELMAGMHDDYMEGKLAAEFYAKALEKVYNALADCDYKHTMSQAVKTETNSQKILNTLDKAEPKTINDAARVVEENITEGAEKCYAAKYTAVDFEGNKTQKKICFMCDGTIEDAEKLADELIKEPYTDLKVIGSVLKGVAEKDGYELIEAVITEELEQPEWFKEFKTQFDVADENQKYELVGYDSPFYDKIEELYGDVIGRFMEAYSSLNLYIEASTQAGMGGIFMTGTDENGEFEAVWDTDDDAEMLVDAFESESIKDVKQNIYNFLFRQLESAGPKDEYDDDYDDGYNESLEECSGIKAHKVIMGEDIDDSIEFDDFDGVEGPEGDKTEDIEFVMDEYVSESLLIDFIEKVDPITYKVGANDQVVTVVFDPKWSEYVYTIDGKGPYSHSSYEFISRDIYDFVMSQIDASELDDLDD